MRSILVLAAVVLLVPEVVHAAPLTAQDIPIQGVVRGADDALIVSGDLAVRVFADSIGGTPVYDSGSEFAGAISNGIVDVVVGAGTPMMLDGEASYFLELDVAGVGIIGGSAGARWRFFPGGGSHARTDLEGRIATLEAAVGLAPARPLLHAARSGLPVIRTSGFTKQHAMIGFGHAAGSSGGVGADGDLLLQPVGEWHAGGIEADLGPFYLFTPGANPLVRFIQDVPSDQGRAVRIRWRKDLRERPYVASDTLPRIASYTVYRRVEPGQAAPAVLSRDRNGLLALPPGDWDVLTTIPATLDSTYQTVVATLCDSTASGICYSTFVVRSITDQVGIYHNSPADSGYSVDNIAPGVPQGLTAQVVTGGTQLSWQPSGDADFQYFNVYRSTDPEFTPDPSTRIHSTTSNQWTDLTTGSFTYELTAVDANGNESAPASVSSTTDVGASVPAELAFASMAPNPFRQTLTMTVEIPRHAGPVELTLFDLAGRRVRTLSAGALSPGRHTFTWDGLDQAGRRAAAGIYIARLSGAGRSLVRRATLLP